MGKLIRTFDKGSSKSSGSPICCLRQIQNSYTMIGAGIDSSVAVVDFRTSQPYELKVKRRHFARLNLECFDESEIRTFL